MLKIINRHLLTRQVDVCMLCITYNHSHYIKQCITGMLSQKGNYSYTILIHDDASVDGTDAIVEEYARSYPETILAVIEEENQYSKGNSIKDVVRSFINARYVSICEGDDWWIDPRKVADQLEVFRADPLCSLCVHETLKYNDMEDVFLEPIRPSMDSRYFSAEEIILGDGGLFATCSYMMPMEYYSLQDVYQGWGIGDYPMAIQCAVEGRVFYIAKPMAVYRVNANGSWSRRQLVNPLQQTDGKRKVISGLNRFDKQYEYKFHSQVERVVERYRYQIAVAEGDLGLMFGKECSQERRAKSIRNLLKDSLICIFPTLHKKYLKKKYS